MAIRDAVKSIAGACSFATGLYYFLHGSKSDEERFYDWSVALETLPRKNTRVVTWPLATVFAFIALPSKHIFLKPTFTRAAAKEYDFQFQYNPRLSWDTYESLLKFGESVERDLRDLNPKDMIDVQSFIWLQGSEEYDE
jgi:hypothetical protein